MPWQRCYNYYLSILYSPTVRSHEQLGFQYDALVLMSLRGNGEAYAAAQMICWDLQKRCVLYSLKPENMVFLNTLHCIQNLIIIII